MDNKTKDAFKTKDAIKQLQAEMRGLQSLLAAQQAGEETPAPQKENGASARKEKADLAVHYAVSYPASGPDEREIKSGAIGVTAAQIGRVTDDSVALLGNALSSPQKVALLRALLSKASESASALGETASLSTGSLYHHLRDLMHAGLIAQSGRSHYALTERGGHVLLVMLALAAQP